MLGPPVTKSVEGQRTRPDSDKTDYLQLRQPSRALQVIHCFGLYVYLVIGFDLHGFEIIPLIAGTVELGYKKLA